MKTVLVPLADGCEELEAITIMDILTRAGAQVISAGLKPGLVIASRGAKLQPDTTLAEVETSTFDLIALPGGLPGADHLANDPVLQKLLKQQADKNAPLAAVCAAPRALAAAGVIQQKTITSYPGSLDHLSGDWRNTGHAVEVDGNIVTGRGPGVAMDFALTLVEKLFGQETRDEVEAALAR